MDRHRKPKQLAQYAKNLGKTRVFERRGQEPNNPQNPWENRSLKTRRRKIRRAPQNTSCAACCMRALRLSLGHKTVCSLIHTLQGHLLAHIKFSRDLLAHLLAHHQPKLIPTGLARTDELDRSRAAKDVELTLCSRLAASKRFSNRSCSKSFATSEQFQNPIAATLSFVLYGLCFGLAAVFNADPLVQSIPRTSASYHIVLIANQSQLRRQDFADTGSEVTDRSRDTILADYSHKAPSSRTQKCTILWRGAGCRIMKSLTCRSAPFVPNR